MPSLAVLLLMVSPEAIWKMIVKVAASGVSVFSVSWWNDGGDNRATYSFKSDVPLCNLIFTIHLEIISTTSSGLTILFCYTDRFLQSSILVSISEFLLLG